MNLNLVLVNILLFVKLQSILTQTTSDCDVSVPCYRYPDNCVDTNCTFIFKWSSKGESTDFTLAGKISNFTNRYLAIGFSNDEKMGQDGVIACKTSGDVHQFWNPSGTSSSVFLNSTDRSVGITQTTVKTNDNWLICQFTRQNQNTNLTNYIDLNKEYNVLAAYGGYNTATERLSKHAFKTASVNKYSFNDTVKNTTEMDVVTNLISTSTCGKTNGCFLSPDNCNGSACTYIFKWSDSGDDIAFVLAGKINTLGNRYLAIGFSNDDKMGEDGVVACKTSGQCHHFYNPNGFSSPVFLNNTNRSVGISAVNVVLNDGWLIGEFKRKKQNNAVPNYVDLTSNKYFILAAHGNYNSTTERLIRHESRIASSGVYAFNETSTTPQAVTYPPAPSQVQNLITSCDGYEGCFVKPDNCKGSECLLVYRWTDEENRTKFNLAGRINTSENRYLAIGFSKDDLMGDEGVVACKTTGVAHHFYNPGGHTASAFLNSSDLSVGLTDINVTLIDKWLVCQFNREKQNNAIGNYTDLNRKYFVLGSFGNFNSTSERLRRHDRWSVSSREYSFNVTNQTNSDSESPTGIAEFASTCGASHVCYKDPSNCNVTDCTVIYKWRNNGNDTDFIIAGKIGTFTNGYLAIGLSQDDSMGSDGVVACKTNEDVHHYNNPNGYEPSVFVMDSKRDVGLSNVNVSKVDEWLICNFKRANQNLNASNYFIINNSHHVLAAYGTFDTVTGALRKHGYKSASSVELSFSQNSTLWITQTTTTPTPPPIADTSVVNLQKSCGVTEGCFYSPNNCKGTDCTYIYKWSDQDDKTNFVLAGKVSSTTGKYLAIGFSKDNKMGDDSIVVCKSNGIIENLYNPNDSPRVIVSSQPSFGLSNMKVTQDGDWLVCEFSRLKQFQTSQARKRRDAANEFFDLNNQFYVLGAIGGFGTSGSLQKHSNKIASSSKANFQSKAIIGGSSNYSKYKAHACLMVIAWILFASIGILFARYYKYLFKDRTFCGVKLWFAIHRPVMLMVIIISIISLLVILAKLDWKWVSTRDKTAFAHSIFGIVSIGLAFFQPFIALLRCDPGNERRWIFNLIHRSFGLSAFLLAVVALFLGSTLDIMGLHSDGWGLLIGWISWLAALVLFLELIVFVYGDDDSIQPNPEPTPQIPNVHPFYHNFSFGPQVQQPVHTPRAMGNLIKSILLIANLVVTLAFTIALLVVIGNADPSSS